MKLSISEIRRALEEALTGRQCPEEIAVIMADEYLRGELQGKKSHGLMAFPAMLKVAGKFKLDKYKIVDKRNAFMIVDAGGLHGSYAGRKVADELMEMAKKEGIAAGFIKNMTTWLRPGSIARYVADHDMVGLVINNGGKAMVAPPGGYDPMIGTNPIGIGVPASASPLVVDMATSKRAWGEVRKAKKNNTDLPKEAFYTNSGSFAVRPDDAYSALPAGDYKGFALGLFVEIMTGSFLGRPMGPDGEADDGWSVEDSDFQTETRGGMILVINPAAATDLNRFKKSNADLIEKIKFGNKLPDMDEIYLAGERASKEEKKNLDSGFLEVDDDLWKQIIG